MNRNEFTDVQVNSLEWDSGRINETIELIVPINISSRELGNKLLNCTTFSTFNYIRNTGGFGKGGRPEMYIMTKYSVIYYIKAHLNDLHFWPTFNLPALNKCQAKVEPTQTVSTRLKFSEKN